MIIINQYKLFSRNNSNNMFFIKIINFVLGKLFNSQNAYLNLSLNYLNRKREYDRNYLDYIRLSALELVAEEINSKKVKGAVAELGVYKGKFAR